VFTLVVENFGVKYTNKADIDHLIGCLKKHMNSLRIGMATCTAA
jgi:hypothetical protein